MKRQMILVYMPYLSLFLFLSIFLCLPHLSLSCRISHFKANWWQQLWNRENLWQTATSTHSHLLIWFLSLAACFWPPCPLSLQKGTIYKMGPVLFGRCPNVMFCFFSPRSLSAEIRGFKVLSYIPLNELPICSQVIRGKQSCVPRLGHAKLCCSHGATWLPSDSHR